ncbi:MAG: hypothetical protein RLY20_1269 [Verrucomicrobiota bacterium]|jgi:hypothetical protein
MQTLEEKCMRCRTYSFRFLRVALMATGVFSLHANGVRMADFLGISELRCSSLQRKSPPSGRALVGEIIPPERAPASAVCKQFL